MGRPPVPEGCSCYHYTEEAGRVSDSKFLRLPKGWLCLGCADFFPDGEKAGTRRFYNFGEIAAGRPSAIGYQTDYTAFPAAVAAHIDRLYKENDRLNNLVQLLIIEILGRQDDGEETDEEGA